MYMQYGSLRPGFWSQGVEGRSLLQPPSGRRSLAPSPPQQEERVGERRLFLLDAPFPARSSRGEGEEDFRWL